MLHAVVSARTAHEREDARWKMVDAKRLMLVVGIVPSLWACAEPTGETPGANNIEIVFDVERPAGGTFIAWQDGDGPWAQLPVLAGSFSVVIEPHEKRYAVAYGCATERTPVAGVEANVRYYYRTVAEAGRLVLEHTCRDGGSARIEGTVTSSSSATNMYALAGSSGRTMRRGETKFELGVKPGKTDVFVSFDAFPEDVVVKRDVAVHEGVNTVTLDPNASVTMSRDNQMLPATGKTTATSRWLTENGTYFVVSDSSAHPAVFNIPQRRAGDKFNGVLTVSEGGASRSVQYSASEARTMWLTALPGPLTGVIRKSMTAASGAPLWAAEWNAVAADVIFVNAVQYGYQTNPELRPDIRSTSISISGAYVNSLTMPMSSFAAPDLTMVPGWRTVFDFDTTNTITVWVAASMGPVIKNGEFTKMVDGSERITTSLMVAQ